MTADLVRDTCGYAVPFMSYEADRDLHGKRFAREDDASLSEYFTKKDHVATSLDGLPWSAAPTASPYGLSHAPRSRRPRVRVPARPDPQPYRPPSPSRWRTPVAAAS